MPLVLLQENGASVNDNNEITGLPGKVFLLYQTTSTTHASSLPQVPVAPKVPGAATLWFSLRPGLVEE